MYRWILVTLPEEARDLLPEKTGHQYWGENFLHVPTCMCVCTRYIQFCELLLPLDNSVMYSTALPAQQCFYALRHPRSVSWDFPCFGFRKFERLPSIVRNLVQSILCVPRTTGGAQNRDRIEPRQTSSEIYYSRVVYSPFLTAANEARLSISLQKNSARRRWRRAARPVRLQRPACVWGRRCGRGSAPSDDGDCEKAVKGSRENEMRPGSGRAGRGLRCTENQRTMTTTPIPRGNNIQNAFEYQPRIRSHRRFDPG